ncbi:MAG: hypothetical protein ACLSHC_16410 [Bilophila wadsworthia]
MSVLLTLAFLVAVVWLLAKAEEKGVLHWQVSLLPSRRRQKRS